MDPKLTETEKLYRLIREWELKKILQEEELKEEVKLTIHNLRPAQLAKNLFNDMFHSPEVRQNAVSTVAGLAAGFISKKLLIRKSSSVIKRILGTLVQIGITKFVSKKINAEKNGGEYLTVISESEISER